MQSPARTVTPTLTTYLSSLKSSPIETSIEQLVSLLRRRQIRNSRPCAIATAHLLRRVLRALRVTNVATLIERVHQVGQRLIAAQPKELAVGNIVRRVLGLIRDEAEEDREGETNAHLGLDRESRVTSSAQLNGDRPPLSVTHISYAVGTKVSAVPSLFSLVPAKGASPLSTPGTQTPGRESPIATPALSTPNTVQEFVAEVIEGIQEVIDELNQVDDQIAGYALDHVHAGEVVLTHTPSLTVQKFLLKAAAKRKFTVVFAETTPRSRQATHMTATPNVGRDDDYGNSEQFLKSLTMASITVLLVPFSAVFALMSKVNKVIMDTHVVLADGGLVAAVGARVIAKAASMHHTPVVVLSGVFKLSPIHPYDTRALIEFGDPRDFIGHAAGNLNQGIDVENPLFDYVPAELLDLYITNLGGHAPSFLYRIVADHYRSEDTHLVTSNLE